MTHAVPPAPVNTATSEPVLIAHAFTALLAVGVGLGWYVFPGQPTVDAIGSVTALVLSLVGAFVARGKVSPTGSQPPWLTDVEATITAIATDVAQAQIDGYVARTP